MKAMIMSAGAALALAGCAAVGDPLPPPQGPMPGSASAELREPGGRLVARTTATQVGDSIRLRVDAAGLAPGTYAAHIHAVGRCDPPSFDSAGPHWNPLDREHGMQNPRGSHMGDLPNLMVGTSGEGFFEYTIPAAQLTGGPMPMLDGDGASLVVHARPDDHRTDPSGNSGARIACGVFR
ncbi:MAG: superoxide dismutase family protein [Allosphingosinicella sp.]|uniref:superoxide dismutase family protein n=1 Tax=Allosphingosinicella sp. TaxID=2823234 RepID=UPI003948E9D3